MSVRGPVPMSVRGPGETSNVNDITTNVLKCVCYLKRIPWQPELPSQFDSIRSRLFHLRSLSQKYQENISVLPKNIPLPGFTAEDIYHPTSNSERDITSQVHIVVNMHLTDKIDAIRYSYWTSNGIKYEIVKFSKFGNHIEGKMRKVIDIWQRLRHSFYLLPYCMRNHPALDIEMVPNTALIINLKVKNCYMEKQSVSWWSLPRLSEVIQHGGLFRGEMFRPNFLPFLAVVLDVLKNCVKKDDESTNEYEVNVIPWRSQSTTATFLKPPLK